MNITELSEQYLRQIVEHGDSEYTRDQAVRELERRAADRARTLKPGGLTVNPGDRDPSTPTTN